MIFINPYIFKNSLKKHLLAYYKFEDLSDTVTVDPNNIAVIYFNYVSGKINNGGRFTATYNQPARVTLTGTTSKFSFTDGTNDLPYSFSFWMYYEGTAATQGNIFGKNSNGSTATNAEYQIYITPTGVLRFEKYSAGSLNNGKRYSTSALSINNWYHIVITDDALGNVNIYINNSLMTLTTANVGTGFVKFSLSIGPAGFGNTIGNPNGNFRFYGILDEFAIFKNYVLSPSDINYLYNSGNGKEIK